MRWCSLRLAPLAFAGVLLPALSFPQADHDHGDHGTSSSEVPVKRPRVFLDKSPRIVAYQLKRLSNAQLLLVERKTDHKKYAPVFAAILKRAGMSPQHRGEALEGLMELNQSSAARELLQVIETIDADDPQQRHTGEQLVSLLLGRPGGELGEAAGDFSGALRSENAFLRQAGYAALIVSGNAAAAAEAAGLDDPGDLNDPDERNASDSPALDWLQAVRLVPERQRSELRPPVVELTDREFAVEVRRGAIEALAHISSEANDTFERLAAFIGETSLRQAIVRTMLTVPAAARQAESSAQVVDALVATAEATPAAQRTTDSFLESVQLVDELLGRLPLAEARAYRQRLRAVTVRVVRIRTVNEEMRYDVPYFAVEAGRPVQVILQNEDLMPHNLVVVSHGALQEVAELGAAAGPTAKSGKQYVPESEKVLFATSMVQPGRQERLTFTAPAKAGEYPYVCTFPRHWMRMYGVMVVVDDLDAWLQDPAPPEDPLGNQRAFVKEWTVDDFGDDLDAQLKGRSPEIGARLFADATCSQCHKVKGKGGAVGPELSGLFERWKGDARAVLREILDPSQRIDPKYAVHVVVTVTGDVVSGVVVAENKTSVSLVDNPEVADKPVTIERTKIASQVKTSTSMMPKALLDRFTKDEILEILAFLRGL